MAGQKCKSLRENKLIINNTTSTDESAELLLHDGIGST